MTDLRRGVWLAQHWLSKFIRLLCPISSSSKGSRRTFAENKCIVVLDTSPARILAHDATTPAWVETFSEMKGHGYLFTLAECAWAELLNQRSKGAISGAQFSTMIYRLEKFLDPSFPVMPGEKDTMMMIGVEPVQANYEQKVSALSQQAWTMLKNQHVDNNDLSRTLLEEERESWIQQFDKFNDLFEAAGSPTDLDKLVHPILEIALRSQDLRCAVVNPPLSKRFDLRTRYCWRQFVRSKKEREPYNARASKKVNDGIDFRLYTYLALPALIVAIDSGFFSSIENIGSFQRPWFKQPDTLADMWKNGDHPLPIWL